MWVLDYLEEVDSDMSAFHRVDDARLTMPAPLYFARAALLAAYPGAMAARARELEARGGPMTARASAPIISDDWIEHDTGGGDPS